MSKHLQTTLKILSVDPAARFDPATSRMTARYSTNWATGLCLFFHIFEQQVLESRARSGMLPDRPEVVGGDQVKIAMDYFFL